MKILERPENCGEDLDKVCKAVFDEVKRDGDEALKKYTWYFDRVKLECFEVTEEEYQKAEREVNAELKEAIRVAKGNIEEFHKIQIPEKCEYVNERGFRCWQEGRAIDRVGLYVPGGSAPLGRLGGHLGKRLLLGLGKGRAAQRGGQQGDQCQG